MYILKWIIPDWDDAHAIKVLKNCHRTMKGRGKALIVEMFVPETNNPLARKNVGFGGDDER